MGGAPFDHHLFPIVQSNMFQLLEGSDWWTVPTDWERLESSVSRHISVDTPVCDVTMGSILESSECYWTWQLVVKRGPLRSERSHYDWYSKWHVLYLYSSSYSITKIIWLTLFPMMYIKYIWMYINIWCPVFLILIECHQGIRWCSPENSDQH